MNHRRPHISAGARLANAKSNDTNTDNSTPGPRGKLRHASSSFSNGNSTPSSIKDTPSLKKIKQESSANMEFFTNNSFSRSFNSLILNDVDDDDDDTIHQSKKINKSPPFNVKQDLYNNDAIDDYLSDNDNTYEQINSMNDPDHDDDDISVSSKYVRPKLESIIKRSSKFLNLSIDSNIKDIEDDGVSSNNISNQSTPKNVNQKLSFELNNSTPINTPYSNKFKRPHQLISKSPSPYLKEKAHITVPKKSPKFQSINKLFNLKNSNKLRKMENSSPIKFEYYNIDDVMIDDADSPSKNRKSSNSSSVKYDDHFDVYKDHSTQIQAKPSHEKLMSARLQAQTQNQMNINDKKSYQFVKPLQTAFKSTGLLKKNSITSQVNKLPPDTPIKKHPIMLFNDKPQFPTNGGIYEQENSSEISIEVGRNHSHQSNDSTISLFKIQHDHENDSANISNQSENKENVIDFEYMDFLETPTKSVKKSTSMPTTTNISPLSIKHHLNPTTPTGKMSKSVHNFSAIKGEPPQRKHKSMSLFDEDGMETEMANFKSFKADKTTTDDHLNKKFGHQNIKYLNKGEFSIAFVCNFDNQKFAIKRSKRPIIGKLEIKNYLREINALRNLTSVKDDECDNLKEQEEGKEFLVYFIEAWEFNNYYYIMTEYCEGGTLFGFLQDNKNYKVDEFRIWKIIIEIMNGLKFIHSKNYLHLDLKPANIFVTFEGYLKIGDFGLATKLPILEKDFDLEGDRNYIAPELINDKIYTPFADVFSVGLIILEIATNIILPDNGTPWRKLRSGDLSDAGKLSSDNLSDFLQNRNFSSLTSYNSVNTMNSHNLQPPYPSNVDQIKELIPKEAPEFLLSNSNNLDKLVNRMLQPNPFDRPTATNVLDMNECITIDNLRKAGATIYEGEFGPNDDDD